VFIVTFIWVIQKLEGKYAKEREQREEKED
jgi:hypothetical protein